MKESVLRGVRLRFLGVVSQEIEKELVGIGVTEERFLDAKAVQNRETLTDAELSDGERGRALSAIHTQGGTDREVSLFGAFDKASWVYRPSRIPTRQEYAIRQGPLFRNRQEEGRRR